MKMLNDASSWYLAQMKPNAHRMAIKNLERQGYQVFLPLQDVNVRKRGKIVSEAKPLFSGYIFVGLTQLQRRLDKINSTYGVNRLVSFGRDPVEVPVELIEDLKDRCDAEGRLLPPQELVVGSEVKVTRGPFFNFVATIEQIADQQRVWVLLDVLGKSTRVSVSTDSLRSA